VCRVYGLRWLWGVVLMVSLSLYPRLLVAQELDVSALVGEDWYGLYLNGQKAGWSRNAVSIEDDKTVVVVEDAHFRVNMAGLNQDMEILSKRCYAPDGSLLQIDYALSDPAGEKDFHAVVTGDELTLTSTIAGETSTKRFPRPAESLKDVLKQAQLVSRGAQVGDSVSFSLFDPMYQKEITGVSRIVETEKRMLDGAETKVFRVHTTMDLMGIESDSFVTEDGTVLEDIVAGIITMRIEPEAMAKDVNYNNDVIVSNAAMIEEPIPEARTREMLRLRLEGPLSGDHLFNDERQTIRAVDGTFDFVGKRVSLEGFKAMRLPLGDTCPDAVAQWLEPTPFVQSDDPKIVAKAREIVGDETDAVAVSKTLCEWVHDNVRTTFSAQLSNAREVLDRLEGDCTEYSILFIGLARAAGLPAREVAGLIYMESGGQPGFYFHQWAKVWVGKWIDVDPTFDQPLADATHIKLAQGDLFEQAKLIPIIGRLRIEVVEPQP